MAADIQQTDITVSYNTDDCNSFTKVKLINDICKTIKIKLTEEIINKPVKCNIAFIYTSLINDLNGDNDSKDTG